MKRLLTAAAILGLVAFMLPAGVALAVAPGTVNLVKVVESGSALPSDFNIGLFREQPGPPPEVPPYHSGDSVAVIPGTYWLFEMPLDGGGYYEESIRCTSPNHDPLSLVLDPGTPVSTDFGLNVPVAAGEVWNCTITNRNAPPGTATPTPTPTPITGWNVSTADCTTVDGHGSITVTGFTGVPADNQQVAVTPGDLVIKKDGTYPLDPGTYNWFYGDRIGGGGPGHDFTIGACPEPTEPAPITGWKVSTADCTTVDGHGSITVTGFTGDDNQSVSVIKGFWVEPIEGVDLPQVLHITANGTYPLDPGTYNWSYGDRIGGGGPGNDFTIGPCPSPSESPSASPSPSPSASPVASPTPKPAVTPTPKPTSTTLPAVITLPQTGTIGASTGGSSSPLVPISIALLLVAATGLMLTRRPKSR